MYVGERQTDEVTLRVIDYNEQRCEEYASVAPGEAVGYRRSDSVTWINVDGLHDVSVIETLGEGFGLHPLVLEDIVNTDQRPKVEPYDEYLYVILNMLRHDEGGDTIVEQVSLVLRGNCVLSFQEREGDVFDTIRRRLRDRRGRIRGMGADYLLYALMDAVVDEYFVIVEGVGERIEHLEGEVISNTDSTVAETIQALKRELLFLRKSVWPLRDVLTRMPKHEEFISGTTQLYLRDVADHAEQIADALETFRDMSAGLMGTYQSTVSNGMNEVMKVLTIIATIFIPLSFVAGWYGMNFQHMPELDDRWAYPTVIGIFVLIAGGMLIYFRRKKWL